MGLKYDVVEGFLADDFFDVGGVVFLELSESESANPSAGFFEEFG